jgi:PIN domain nuclease of toxin-antitoxin system
VDNLYILDACAIIALIKKETGWESVFNVLSKAVKGETIVFMHETNLLEVYYGLYKERGKEYAEKKIAEASTFFVEINGLAISRKLFASLFLNESIRKL